MKIITTSNHTLSKYSIDTNKEVVLNIEHSASGCRFSNECERINLHPSSEVKTLIQHGLIAEAYECYKKSLKPCTIYKIAKLVETRKVIITSQEKPQTFNLRYIVASVINELTGVEVLELGYTKESYKALKQVQEDLHNRPFASAEYIGAVGV